MVADNIRIFAEAAAAADELAAGLSKLSRFVADTAGRGTEEIHWSTARELSKRTYYSRDTSLWIGAAPRARTTLAEIMVEPRSQDWDLVSTSVAGTWHQIDRLALDLKRENEKFSYRPLFGGLIKSLQANAPILQAVPMAQPQSADELVAAKDFLTRYAILVDEICTLHEAVGAYVNRLKSDGKWPIRGD